LSLAGSLTGVRRREDEDVEDEESTKPEKQKTSDGEPERDCFDVRIVLGVSPRAGQLVSVRSRLHCLLAATGYHDTDDDDDYSYCCSHMHDEGVGVWRCLDEVTLCRYRNLTI